MKEVTVIGGGFAGLSAGVELADRGIRVTVLEGRGHLGGRAYSFRHKPTGDTVDNGQHLFMGCYTATREFLRRIGTDDLLVFQDSLRIDFRHPRRGSMSLALPRRLPRSLRLMVGLARYPGFRWGDAIGMAKIARSLNSPGDGGEDVETWLAAAGQSADLRETFWDPLCLAALNRAPHEAPAAELRAVLSEAFFGQPDGASLGYAGVGLSGLYTDAARLFIENRGGKVLLSHRAQRVSRAKDGGIRVDVRNHGPTFAGAVVCAVPPETMVGLLPAELEGLMASLKAFRPSAILSVNLWLSKPVLPCRLLGLLGTSMQWAFSKPDLYEGRDAASEGHITLVASAADALVALDDGALVDRAMADLRTLVPNAADASVEHHLVVRERSATLGLPPGRSRPGNATNWPNLFLAGDWTDTGLPATIESAVRSGTRAAALAAAI